MMVIPLLLHSTDPALGGQCLTAAVDRGRLEEGPGGYRNWRLRKVDMRRIASQVAAQPYLPKSYLGGATPENLYKMPAPPYVVRVSDNTYSGDPDSGTYKVYVSCSGAASPRPVTVVRNNRGIWKAREWSSIIVGVKAPPTQRDDDL